MMQEGLIGGDRGMVLCKNCFLERVVVDGKMRVRSVGLRWFPALELLQPDGLKRDLFLF